MRKCTVMALPGGGSVVTITSMNSKIPTFWSKEFISGVMKGRIPKTARHRQSRDNGVSSFPKASNTHTHIYILEDIEVPQPGKS